jgi:uncharacterized protein (UPF0332 family)
MTEFELKPLVEKAERALKSARLLLDNEDFEATVSRTYYAMFYIVEAILLTKNLKFKSHRGVISAFGQHFIKTEIFPKELSKQLRNAMDKRYEGDYEYITKISKDEAKKLLDTGKSFVNRLIEYLTNNRFL